MSEVVESSDFIDSEVLSEQELNKQKRERRRKRAHLSYDTTDDESDGYKEKNKSKTHKTKQQPHYMSENLPPLPQPPGSLCAENIGKCNL